MAQYDDIIRNQTEGMRSAFAPLVQHGNNQVTLAALQLQRQQEMQDMAQRNLFAQQLIDRQQHYTKLRDESQAREHMAILREQSKLMAERQAADDERAYRKQVEAEAFRYGVESKGVTTDDLIKKLDTKIAENVKSDLAKRQDVANQIINLMGSSSKTAKDRITKDALNDPELLKVMSPDTIQKLREGKTTIADVVANLGKRGIWNSLPFTNSGVDNAKAAFTLYANALKQATELDQTLHPDFQLAVRLQTLNNDLQILDKSISDMFPRIRNIDKAKGIFNTPTATSTSTTPSANPFGMSVPVRGGFPIGIPGNPLAGLGLPPARPISNAQALPPEVSGVGDVIPAQQGGPYGTAQGAIPALLPINAARNLINTVGNAPQIIGDAARTGIDAIYNSPYFQDLSKNFIPLEP